MLWKIDPENLNFEETLQELCIFMTTISTFRFNPWITWQIVSFEIFLLKSHMINTIVIYWYIKSKIFSDSY